MNIVLKQISPKIIGFNPNVNNIRIKPYYFLHFFYLFKSLSSSEDVGPFSVQPDMFKLGVFFNTCVY